MARYTDEERQQILDAFFKYIDETDQPIIAEFAYQNDVLRETLYYWASKDKPEDQEEKTDNRTFAYGIKKALAKSEAWNVRQLDKPGLSVAGPIFRLKALHGLRDSDPAAAGDPVTVNINMPKLDKADPDALQRMSGDILGALNDAQKGATKRGKRSAN